MIVDCDVNSNHLISSETSLYLVHSFSSVNGLMINAKRPPAAMPMTDCRRWSEAIIKCMQGQSSRNKYFSAARNLAEFGGILLVVKVVIFQLVYVMT